MIAKTISILSFLLLLAFGTFFLGMWTTYKNWWVWEKVSEAQLSWRAYRDTGALVPPDSYVHRDPSAPDTVYTVNDKAAISPGLLVINRFDQAMRGYVLELIDEQGKVVQSRPLDYSRIMKGGNRQEFVHVTMMLPDGSVLAVFDDAPGLARLDACGNPIWARTDLNFHHSIEKADDGYWTWASGIWNGGHDQRMIRFDPETGKTLESIDLVDDVIAKSEQDSLAVRIPDGFKFDKMAKPGSLIDIIHPNDLEALTAAMAPAFPQFNAGDLLVSFRNIDTIAVIDRVTHRIKWVQYGPWYRQHDTDFQPDGTITMFSNNTDHFRSSIIQIDPKTNISKDLFWGSGLDFDSYIMGKHQHLSNGNWLITVSMEGRVLEVTSAGKIVREYNNILNGTYNSVVPYAEHLVPGFLAAVPVCKG